MFSDCLQRDKKRSPGVSCYLILQLARVTMCSTCYGESLSAHCKLVHYRAGRRASLIFTKTKRTDTSKRHGCYTRPRPTFSGCSIDDRNLAACRLRKRPICSTLNGRNWRPTVERCGRLGLGPSLRSTDASIPNGQGWGNIMLAETSSPGRTCSTMRRSRSFLLSRSSMWSRWQQISLQPALVMSVTGSMKQSAVCIASMRHTPRNGIRVSMLRRFCSSQPNIVQRPSLYLTGVSELFYE